MNLPFNWTPNGEIASLNDTHIAAHIEGSEPIWFSYSSAFNISSLQNEPGMYSAVDNTSLYLEDSNPYHGAELQTFRWWYISNVHGVLALCVCIFGIIANVLNIIVLSRHSMVSPTNSILIGLAVADMLVMLSYVPYDIFTYILRDMTEDDTKQSYSQALYTLMHMHVTVVFHTISTWLTVTLAIWRFIAVTLPVQGKKLCSMPRAKIAIATTYVACAIGSFPLYLTFSVRQQKKPTTGDVYFTVDFSNITQNNDNFLQNLNFWTYSVLMKLVPCIALTVLSLGLMRVLYEANDRKRRLKQRVDASDTKSNDRTTRMLLAVLLLFLVTEFPSGIAALLSGILGDEFFHNVYVNCGEIMDILALINSAVNFILYCSMSRQFRKTFAALFMPKIVTKWVQIPMNDHNATVATTCV